MNMYATPHAAVALAINTTVYAITGDITTTLLVGVPLAIISHYFVDYLLEYGLNKKDNLLYEGIAGLLFYAPILFLPNKLFFLSFFLLSWFTGNFMDLVDKKGYLSVFNPKKHPPTFYFHKQPKGAGIKFTLKMTKQASIVAIIISFACGFILYNLINN